MTKEVALQIEERIKNADAEEAVGKKLIQDIKALLTDENGEVLVDECASLSHQTALKITYRTVQGLEGPEKAIGVKYNNTAIEFAKV